MYTRCTTENAAAKQRLFQDTLLSQLKHQAYEEITVTQLCELTKLSRKVFYRLFDCKDDVLCALIDTTLRDFHFYKSREDTLEGELRRVFSYWLEQAPLLDALARNRQTALLMERNLMYISPEDPETIHAIQAAGLPYQEETLLFFLSGISGLLIYWHHTGYRRSVEDMAKIAAELLTRPPIPPQMYP